MSGQSNSSATPPLLLTKRLNGFLHANQTPQLPTLLLTTSHGKLLAHASPHPVSVLRTHATVAASLFAIHTSSSLALPSALPGAETPGYLSGGSPTTDDGHDDDDDAIHHEDDNDSDHQSRVRGRRGRGGRGISGSSDDAAAATADGVATRRKPRNPIKPVNITVQLSGGTVVIRRLKCGLLFVCVGPSAQDQAEMHPHSQSHSHHHHHHPQHHENGDNTGSPSEVESLISAGGQTTSSLESATAASVVAMRRHAADLARWLDGKLGTLKVPEDSIIAE